VIKSFYGLFFIWNSLPVELREPTVSIGVFRRTLKTILFARY